VTQEAVLEEPVMVVGGPDQPLADAPSVSFEQLAEHDWILPPAETTLRRQADEFFLSRGAAAPRSGVESVSYLANRALLRRRNFVAVMPAQVAAADIDRGLLAIVDWTPPFGAGSVGVSHRGEEGLSPAGAAFLAALRVEAQALGPTAAAG